MINIQELLAASKAKENNQLVKGFGSLFNGHLMTIAKSVLILVLLFHQKEARNKLSSPNPSRNYLIGMVVT
jgi:hypothetical protein